MKSFRINRVLNDCCRISKSRASTEATSARSMYKMGGSTFYSNIQAEEEKSSEFHLNLQSSIEQLKYSQDDLFKSYCFWNSLNNDQKQSHGVAAIDLSDYWLCEIAPASYSEKFTKVCEQQSRWLADNIEDPEVKTYFKSFEHMSRNDQNLALLKDFPYSTSYKEGDGYHKLIPVYTCEFENCKKEFTRSWGLLDHARQHEHIQPFLCHYCYKTFTQKGNLKKHEKVHEQPWLQERKRFACQHCNCKYTERYNYRVSLKDAYHPSDSIQNIEIGFIAIHSCPYRFPPFPK